MELNNRAWKNWKKGHKLQKQFWYAYYYKHSLIQEKTIMYQAYRNNIMGGNPYGIFCELMKNREYEDYTHIWVYKNENSLNDDTFQKFSSYPNVIYVRNGTKQYYKFLASCRYLISNAAFPLYWIKKEGQIYINTWHGTPLKTLGRQAKDRNLSSVINAQRNFFLSDYMVMPNRYTIDRITEAYDLKGLFSGKVIDAGYPRTDLVLNTDKNHIREILQKRLGISLNGKKVVLYAPTFRSKQGESVNTAKETGEYMRKLMEILPPDYELVFKVHNMMASFFKTDKYMADRLIFDEIETNELLSITDVLITDYSSIFFDFLCQKKPILFFVYDRQEYENGRGLYRPLEELPGAVCETIEELGENLRKIQEGNYEEGKNFADYFREFAYHDDGNASRRVVDIIFGQKPGMEQYVYQADQEGNRVMLLADPILTPEMKWNCIRILKELDYEKDTVVLLARNGFSFTEDWEAVSDKIHLIASSPAFLMTAFEKLCYKCFHKVPENAEFFQRQYEKFFGKIYFEKIFDIHKNHSLWKDILKKQCKEYITVPKPGRAAQLKKLRTDAGHKITALFIAAYDSVNYVFVNIIRELEHRDYKTMLVVLDAENEMNNKMFSANHIPFVGIKEFDVEKLMEVDFVFLTPFQNAGVKSLYKKIEQHKIFCISFATLFSSITMRVYTDLIFAIGTSKFQEFEENGLHYSMVAIGNPQYDDLVCGRAENFCVKEKGIKRVLFIDQGGYPFGKEGKKILGQVLLAMAEYHPDKEFVIKPRYLPEEVSKSVLHRPSEHIYDFIPEPPDNLCFMKQSVILEEMMPEFDAVVTMWSTAYLDASLMGIPVMLIRGLPSQEVFDVRNQRIDEAFERLAHSGCVVDYREVLQGKLEFRYVDEDYLREEVENVGHPCTPQLVDTLEELYDKLIIPGRRLADVVQMDIQTFQEQLPSLKTIDVQGNCYQRRRAFLKYFNEEIQELVFHNRCMAKPFDLQPLQKYWYFQPEDTFDKEQAEALNTEVQRTVEKIREDYFSSAQMMLETDPIRLDFYFEWLYKNGESEQIFSCKNPCVLPETRAYYQAAVYFSRGEYDEAAGEFAVYYHRINEVEVKPLLKDRQVNYGFLPKNLKCAEFFDALYQHREYDLLKEMGETACFDIYLRTYYLLKVLEEERQIEKLMESYQQFLACARQPKKPKNQSNKMRRSEYYLACVQIGERYQKVSGQKEEDDVSETLCNCRSGM